MGAWLEGSHVLIGEDSSVGRNCMLDGRGQLTIGNHVSISPDVHLITGSHDLNSSDFRFVSAPIVLEDFVWVGSRATILPGVTVGRGAVVATGAVVTRNVDPMTVVGGVPARKIGIRSSELYVFASLDPSVLLNGARFKSWNSNVTAQAEQSELRRPNTYFVAFRYGNHAGPSGYDRFADYLGESITVSPLLRSMGTRFGLPAKITSWTCGSYEYSRHDAIRSLQRGAYGSTQRFAVSLPVWRKVAPVPWTVQSLARSSDCWKLPPLRVQIPVVLSFNKTLSVD